MDKYTDIAVCYAGEEFVLRHVNLVSVRKAGDFLLIEFGTESCRRSDEKIHHILVPNIDGLRVEIR